MKDRFKITDYRRISFVISPPRQGTAEPPRRNIVQHSARKDPSPLLSPKYKFTFRG